MPPVLCLNGPNLDLLGSRQPEVYGHETLADLEEAVGAWGRRLGFEVECLQSNDESELIEAVHGAGEMAGVVFNPGAFTHTSAALGDAVAAVETPVVEVHLSNVRARERWRRRSYVGRGAVATIFGRGMEGYRAALRHLLNRRSHPVETHRYGPHPDQVFDVRRAGSSLGAVLIHGGFWLDAWGRDTTESWAVDLAQRGIPTANLEYRRLGSGGGAVPTHSDVGRGLTAAAQALGTTAVVVVGHSAGAHLALGVSHRPGFPAEAVVSVAGVLDLDEADREGRGGGAVARFDPSHSTSPLASPPPPVALTLVHGASDSVVPPSHSLRYAEYLVEEGASPRTVMVDGTGHFDALDPSNPLWDRVLESLHSIAAPGPPSASF